MLKELFNGNYYIFEIADGGFGIVKANGKEEAVKDILKSYHKHGCSDLKETDVVITSIKEECSEPFKDSENIVELGWECTLWK